MTATPYIKVENGKRYLVLPFPAMPAAFVVWKRRTERRLERIDRALDARGRTTVRDLHPTLDDSSIEAMARWMYAEIKAARALG